jgi:hypothetical protein
LSGFSVRKAHIALRSLQYGNSASALERSLIGPYMAVWGDVSMSLEDSFPDGLDTLRTGRIARTARIFSE